MTRLGFDAYLDHLRRESARFREVLTGCDPTTPVPGCPGWDAADLVWHLAEVQWSWARTVRTRPAALSESDVVTPTRPTTYAELLEAFDDFSAALVTELERADPADPAWTWAPEQTVGFTYRRQAQEALIHRLDAEQTAGVSSPLDPALAADGIDEVLDVMYGGSPAWGAFEPLPHHVEVTAGDTGDTVWVQLGRFHGTDPDGVECDEADISVVADPGRPADAVVSGSAADLDAWLWRRTDDSRIDVTGNREIYDRFREVVSQPLN